MNLVKFSGFSNGRNRFNILGVTGFIAKRKYKSRGYSIQRQRTFTQLHLGKVSVGIEMRKRHTWNFTG